jgi:hypothetical protein
VAAECPLRLFEWWGNVYGSQNGCYSEFRKTPEYFLVGKPHGRHTVGALISTSQRFVRNELTVAMLLGGVRVRRVSYLDHQAFTILCDLCS